MDGTVLLADDDRTIRTVLTQALTRAGCKVHATGALETLKRWVAEGLGDLIITDVMMPDGNGIAALPEIARARPGLPVIVISAQNTIKTAVQATEAAAFDYLPKPFDLPDLLARVARGLAAPRAKPAPALPVAQGEALPLVGRSAPMQALYRTVARVMNSDLPLLITGPSGSGKSLLARAVHDLSARADRAFLSAAKGEVAPGGTLVVDEPADLSPEDQAALVRLIDRAEAAQMRLVTTAQRTEGLRPDLYYRLAGVTLVMPSLAQRVEDVPLLAAHALGKAAPGLHFSDAALAALRAASWPGEVRQLEQAVRGLAALASGPELGTEDVRRALSGGAAASESLSAAVARHVQRYFDLHEGALPPPGLYDRVLREIEAPLLEIALEAVGGNQAKCADLLGINRNTLRKKLTELDLRVTRRRKLM